MSGRTVDRKELERVLDTVIRGEVTSEIFSRWIQKVLVAEEVEVDERDNVVVWMVVYWLSDCIDRSGECDLLTWIERYRRVLATAPTNEKAEILLGLAGARDVLLEPLRSLVNGLMTREEYNAFIDKREGWPPDLRQLMKSLPDRTPGALIAALDREDYGEIARSLQLS